MDYQKIKSEIMDIIQIVKECPENIQEKCFEILLNQFLSKEKVSSKEKIKDKSIEEIQLDSSTSEDSEIDKGEQHEEIHKTDFHMKTRRFIESSSISYDSINKLYYKEEDKILPLYEELGTNKMAESQIRISLLEAFQNSFKTGEFEFDGEVVREICKNQKCYDAANFAATFKNQKELFDGFTKYKKKEKIKLSAKGKTELVKVLKEIVKL